MGELRKSAWHGRLALQAPSLQLKSAKADWVVGVGTAAWRLQRQADSLSLLKQTAR
jgi:hypothetical protein